jgi:EAL domain-containing protein (putative c-di-GMP-specific phosphodiesterase class I)
MLARACGQMSAWRAAYPAKKSLVISVGVPAPHFLAAEFPGQVEGILKAAGLDNRVLMLSVDETVFLNHPDAAPQVYQQIREKGIGIEIDNFATIYSPLGYPQNLASLRVKIGPSAMQSLTQDGRLEVVRALMSLAQVMPVVAVAKGIQTLRQLNELKALGCQFGQGDLFSRPLEAEAAENLLRGKPGTTLQAPLSPRSTGET